MTSNKRQKLSIGLSLEPTSTSTSTLTSQNGHHSIEHPVRATLSERLKNLWDQRGDFSDFNADKLRLKLKSQQQDHDDGQERVAENQGSGEKRKSSLDKTEFDFQIPEDEESDPNGKGKGKEKEQQTSEESTDKQDLNSSSNDPSSRDTITSNEMFNLRIEMMNHLSQAHYDLFYLSSLLTYVSNFTKPQPQQSNTHTNNLSLTSRAASPSTSSVGRGRNNQARTTGTGGGSGSVNDQSQHFQSQTPAEELGLDPHSIGLSLVMNESKARRDKKQEEDDDDEDDEEEEEFLEPLDIKNLSIKERIRENSLLISEKRNSLVNSIDILRNGARSINPLDLVDEDQYQEKEEEVKASNDSRNSEMERFEILKKLKSNGWGINPSKAQLPKNVFGMSLEVGGQAVNNEDGGGLNGARDCLIGWGVPEALSHFRTQSFAYIGSSSSKEPDSSPSSELIFPRRQYRRLRVVFVVNRSEIIDGKEESIEERYGSFIPDLDDQNHVKPKEVVKESDRDIEMRDPSSSNVDQERVEEKQEKVDLDSELKKAQKEMMDEELFSELVGQYRRIERKFGLDDDFFGIDDKLIPSSNRQKNLGGGDSFKPKTKLSMNHLSISLNSKVELRFEMVPTAASDDIKKKKKNLDEITDIKKEHYHFSHVASLVRGYFEMEIIRRYRSRAGIDSTTTTSSSSIGQKTNNWKAGKKTLEDERRSKEGHSLQYLIMIVRYFTFVNQLDALLSKIVSDQNSTSKVQSHSKIELSWNPISNIADLGNWIEQLMLGQTDNESQSGLIGIVESLGGNASLWRRNKPIATLTFSSSLNLSLQLPQPFRPGSSAADENQDAKENPGSRQKNQVPRDGKGRTINGLNLKQLELFLKNALMES